MTICSGIARSKKPCRAEAMDNSKYCANHNYFTNYTSEQLATLRSADTKWKTCRNCGHWIIEKCTCVINTADKCTAITTTKKKCMLAQVNDTDYCNVHQYFTKFTDEQLKSITDDDGVVSSCDICGKWHDPNDTVDCELVQETRKEQLIKVKATRKANKAVLKCIGYTRDGKKCYVGMKKENMYCTHHEYLKEFSKEQLDAIRDGGLGIMSSCNHCGRWRVYDGYNRCPADREDSKKRNAKVIEERKLIKCQGIDRYGNKCVHLQKYGLFCREHKHMRYYTEDMMNNLKLCSGCLKQYYLPDMKTCDLCRLRAKDAKEEAKYMPCNGITRMRTKCKTLLPDNELFCEYHDYQQDWSRANLIEIFNSDPKWNQCKKCYHWCKDVCDCGNVINKKIVLMKCAGMMCDGTVCGAATNIGKYCDKHEYMKKYTTDVMNNLKPCKTCDKMCCFKGNFRLCDNCMEYIKEDPNTCKYDGCLYSSKTKYNKRNNGYCGKHQIYGLYKAQQEHLGSIVCKNFIRGCRAIITDEYKLCINCRCNTVVRLYDIKRGASKRGYSMDLNDEEIIDLINKPCSYCGSVSIVKNNYGIDRIDSLLPYTKDNSCTACYSCNMMKRDHGVNEFVKYCRNILNNYPNTKLIKPNVTFDSHKSWLGNNKDRSNKNIKIETHLTYDQYMDLMKIGCYYCNNENMKKLGIDRLDSKKIYDINNSKSCCYVCNLMKRSDNVDDFLKNLKQIITYHTTNNGFKFSKLV